SRRPPSRARLHLAAQHAGAWQPHPLRRRMEAGAAPDRRRLRASRGPPHPVPGLRQERPGLLPDLSPPNARAGLGTDLRRERLEARVPGTGLVDVEVVLLHLAME